LPKWSPPPDTNAALVTRWNDYQRALLQHEYGHVRHGQQAAQDMIERVKLLTDFPSRTELRAALKEINDSLLAKYRQLDADYDNETHHGVRQGAYFP
jgi:predicted secreted Zn-dependent protease